MKVLIHNHWNVVKLTLLNCPFYVFLSTVGKKAPTTHQHSTKACKIAYWVPKQSSKSVNVSKKPPSEPIDVESLELSNRGQQAKTDKTWIHDELYCLMQSDIEISF